MGLDPALVGPTGIAVLDEAGALAVASVAYVQTDDWAWRVGDDLMAACGVSPRSCDVAVEADTYRNRAWQLGQALGMLRARLELDPALITPVRTTEWRRWAYGWLPDRDTAKTLAVAWCKERFGVVLTHDAAEAAVVASWRRAVLLGDCARPEKKRRATGAGRPAARSARPRRAPGTRKARRPRRA